jgi:membrane fusion protein (multidrug efflux system)
MNRVRTSIVGGTVAVVAVGVLLVVRAGARTNQVALAGEAKGVTAVAARAARYRPSRRYVGTVQPWIEAKIGPQLTSGYVDTVLVRPGDVVKRGQVIATLDCRNASAGSRAVAMRARAIQSEQEAIAHEAARVKELEHGGFASPNEIEQHAASSASKQAELLETEARLKRASLEVSDCVLRAPFAGEVAARSVDPGTFIHPGAAVATVIDRSTVRIVADVPESDFGVVGVGTPVRIRALATDRALEAPIARRSPAAELTTRTVHVEIDVPDPQRTLPTGTTAELAIDVGEPVAASEVPLTAAAVRGHKATLFVVDGDRARKQIGTVLGERGSSLFLTPLPPGTQVVTEGRSRLEDGERIAPRLEVAGAP